MKRNLSPLAKALPHGAGKQLAEFLGVAESTFNAWVHHRTPPKAYIVPIEWWCRVHANPVSIEELMGVEFPPGCRVRASDPLPDPAVLAAMDLAAETERARPFEARLWEAAKSAHVWPDHCTAPGSLAQVIHRPVELCDRMPEPTVAAELDSTDDDDNDDGHEGGAMVAPFFGPDFFAESEVR